VSTVRQRSSILVVVVGVALSAAACGRATDEQINQALGITPTATLSAEQMAAATESAEATTAARTAVASSPGAGVVGDVAQGKRQFETWCSNCHREGGIGPDILAPGSAGASVTAETLLPLVREGEGHTPPGPYKTTELTDKWITDIAAYLNLEAGG
jgi:mono/diheme cytochrome c family protein